MLTCRLATRNSTANLMASSATRQQELLLHCETATTSLPSVSRSPCAQRVAAEAIFRRQRHVPLGRDFGVSIWNGASLLRWRQRTNDGVQRKTRSIFCTVA